MARRPHDMDSRRWRIAAILLVVTAGVAVAGGQVAAGSGAERPQAQARTEVEHAPAQVGHPSQASERVAWRLGPVDLDSPRGGRPDTFQMLGRPGTF